MTSHPDDEFMSEAMALEAAYLVSDDPLVQSGFHGGRGRWVAERKPLVGGINASGEFLDVGCANGLLVSDVVRWAEARGYHIVPHGVDIGPALIALAKQRLDEHDANFVTADAWTLRPGRQWTFVYSLLDLSPTDLVYEWLHRPYGWVEPRGRLIVGSYGNRALGQAPVDVNAVLHESGYEVTASASGGASPMSRFAWVSKP